MLQAGGFSVGGASWTVLIVVALVVIVTITALLRARREDVPRVFDSFVRIFGSLGWLANVRRSSKE
ncbi:hypothetical protein SMNI109538_17100 [Smaragdicoccus niigatensis]